MNNMDRRLRVLLVPDFDAWVTGTIACQTATHCDGIEATVCSDPGYRFLIERYGASILSGFDLVHFLDAQLSARHGPGACAHLPTVCTINHVEDETSLNCVPFADRLMSLCDQQRNLLVRAGINRNLIGKVTVGCDHSVFHPPSAAERLSARNRLGFRSDQIVVGFVAKKALSGRKGSDILVKAIEEIVKQSPQRFGFLMIGPGWSQLVERLRDQGVAVHYSSYVDDHHQLAPMYHCMNVFWVTSRIEGGPVPLIEAMASGVYSISTEVGIAGEIVRHGENGALVPFDDPEAVVAQTLSWADLTDNEKFELSEAAVSEVAERWQWRHVVQAARPIYQQAVESGIARLAKAGLASSTAVSVSTGEMDDPIAPARGPIEGAEGFPGWNAEVLRQVQALDAIAFADNLDMIGERRVANAFRRRQIRRDPFGHASIPILRQWVSRSRIGAVYRWLRRRPSVPAERKESNQ